MFKLFKKREAEEAKAGEGRFLVYLHVADDGWRAAIVDKHHEHETRMIGDQGEAAKVLVDLPKDHGTEQAIEQMFKLAGDGLRQHESQRISDIRIVIGDPRVMYIDMLPDIFSSASTATLHEYGRANLRCRGVSFGLAKFGPVDRGLAKASGGVIAFIDAARLGAYLSRLDRLALKVRAVTPISDIMLRQAHSKPHSGPAVSLYIGALSSILVLSNPTIGAIVRRVLPFGVGVLGRLLAEGSGVSYDQAMGSLAEQDLISELRIGGETDGFDTLTSSPAERILGGAIRSFLADINASVAFFEEQRCAGRPVSMDIYGDLSRVRGLERLLRESLSQAPAPLTVTFETHSLVDLIQALPTEAPLNLLSEATGDLRIGAVTYTFQNQQFRPSEEVRREVAARDQAKPQHRHASKTTRARRGASEAAAKPSLLAQLRARLNGQTQGGSEEDAAVRRMDQQGFAVLGLLVVGVGYLLFNMSSDVHNKYNNQIAAFDLAMADNSQRHQAVSSGGIQYHAADDVDKVLWTEKIISLSNHLTSEIWLTDLYLTTETRTIDKVALSTKKLVMEGAVLPSTDGHIQKIAEYIDALQNDKSQFMSDFRDITFEGLSIDTSESDQVVRFTIEAWYDESKRQEIVSTAAAANGTGGIDAMKQATEQHNQQLQKIPGMAPAGAH
jgi:hypothetical protein